MPNRGIYNDEKEILRLLRGTVFICGYKDKRPCSLTEDQIKKYPRSFVNQYDSILRFGNATLSNELLDSFRFSVNMPTVSAFVQQRDKLLPSAFESIFHKFTKRTSLRRSQSCIFEVTVFVSFKNTVCPRSLNPLHAVRIPFSTVAMTGILVFSSLFPGPRYTRCCPGRCLAAPTVFGVLGVSFLSSRSRS